MAKLTEPGIASRLKSDRAATFSKTLRHEMTRAETLLWAELRGLRLHGLPIRRQAPIGPFVADVVCHRARLVIEVDGPVHVGAEAKDAARTKWLEGRGYRVMRISAAEVESDPAAAGLKVLAELERRLRVKE